MAKSDQEILDLLQKNLDFGFTQVVKLNHERVYWHVRRIVLNHEDANDVTQNTFLKAYKNIQHFKGESKIFSWLYRIATNESLNFLAQKARKNKSSIEEYSNHLASSLQSDSFFDGDALALNLQKAIAKLPEKQKLVFQMRYYEDLKYQEISTILNTSVGALKASYHHAKQKIEQEIKATI